MHRSTISIAFVLLAIAIATAAQAAEDRGGPVLRALEHADADKNGEVSLDELRKVRPNATPEQFRRFDTNRDNVWSTADVPDAELRRANRDGVVSRDEAQKALPEMTDWQFDVFDRDDDGVLSEADLGGDTRQAGMRQQIHQADLNRDGRVTFDEARQRLEGMTEERFKRLDRNGDGALTREDAPGGTERDAMRERLRAADTDGDKKVSFDEAKAAVPALDKTVFSRMDRNGDGFLSAADRVQGRGDTKYDSNSAQHHAARKALSADVNGDGQVTFEELTSVKPGYPREAFDRIDANKDGTVSADEAQNAR